MIHLDKFPVCPKIVTSIKNIEQVSNFISLDNDHDIEYQLNRFQSIRGT